ncbi:MAG: cation-translocating P-type ATPase C-terminal domain-containing protein [Candidatus Methanoperedens sp.]|nr:cation-translocating P-type ATPase C-terminal domain-containing protein [Candidatus Methanoperedens sp.]
MVDYPYLDSFTQKKLESLYNFSAMVKLIIFLTSSAFGLGMPDCSSGQVEQGHMVKPPRNPKENILPKRILLYTLGVTSTIFLGTFALFTWTWNVNQNLPLAEGTTLVQTTAFATLITFELFNALNSRSLEQSLWRLN